MIRRLGLAIAAVVAGLLLTASPALAYNGPGSDCFAPPTPASPSGGVSSWVDPGPARPVTGDPFSTAPNHPTIYDVYGYAGTSIVAYDPPTIGPTCISGDATTSLTNAMMGVSSVTVAVAVRMYRTILSPTFGAIFDPIQHAAQNIIGNGLFFPLAGATIIAAGMWFLWRSNRDSVAHTANRTGKLVAIIAAGIVCTIYPLTVGGAVDKVVGQMVSTVSGMAIQNDPRHSPADALGGAVQTAVNYQTWAQVTFGPGPLGQQAAAEFGPRLFEAGAWTRTEDAAIQKDPAQAQPWTDAKQQRYKDVMAQIAVKYPTVYEYARGAQTDTGFGFAFVGMVGAVLAVGFLIFALWRIAYSLILIRVAIGAAPAVALLAAFPTQQHRASALFTLIWKALITGVVLGAAAIVFTVAGVGGIMSPSTQLPPFVKLLAMALLTYTLYRGAKQFGVISAHTKRKQDEADRRGERFDQPVREPVASPEPSYAFTAESRMRTRTAPVARARNAVLSGASGGSSRALTGPSPVLALRPAPPKPRQLGMSPNYLPSLPAGKGSVYKIHSLGSSVK